MSNRLPEIIRSPALSGARAGPLAPRYWNGEIASVLIPAARIERRVQTLARQITADFAGSELVVVALLTGTVVFLADLLRGLSLPLRLDFIGVSSYGAGTRPGRLVFTKELRLDVAGRDVLVVDDILDTGRTLVEILKRLRPLRPRRIRICVLLEKRRRRPTRVRPDYTGFIIPDLFVVGYGLDYAERHRNLPFIGVLDSRLCHAPGARIRASSPGSGHSP